MHNYLVWDSVGREEVPVLQSLSLWPDMQLAQVSPSSRHIYIYTYMYFSPSGGIMDTNPLWPILTQKWSVTAVWEVHLLQTSVHVMYVHIQRKCRPRQLWSIWVSDTQYEYQLHSLGKDRFLLEPVGKENLHICIWTRRYPGYCKTAVVRFRYGVIPLPSILLLLSYRYYHWTVLAILWLHLCVMYSFAMKKACERSGVCHNKVCMENVIHCLYFTREGWRWGYEITTDWVTLMLFLLVNHIVTIWLLKYYRLHDMMINTYWFTQAVMLHDNWWFTQAAMSHDNWWFIQAAMSHDKWWFTQAATLHDKMLN